jgi:hypothetical protein
MSRTGRKSVSGHFEHDQQDVDAKDGNEVGDGEQFRHGSAPEGLGARYIVVNVVDDNP